MSNKSCIGMCANPFGGAARLDRIDFREYASGTDTPYKALYLKVIADAASDYLFFGFGQNGTVADEFWYAVEYFFTCHSSRPETWQRAKFMRHAYVDDKTGKRVSTTLMLTDDELKQACFDRHYEIAELDRLMPFDQFQEWLKIRREELIRENKAQVDAHIDLLQATGMKAIQGEQQVPFKLECADRMQVLVHPECPEQVAEMIFYSPRYRRAQVRRPALTRMRRELAVTAPCRGIVAPLGQASFVMV